MSNRPGMVQCASNSTGGNGVSHRISRLGGGLKHGVLYAAISLGLSVVLSACHTAPQNPVIAAAPGFPSARLSDTQVELLKKQGFMLTSDGWMLRLSDKLLFDTDESSLRDDSRELITQLGTTLHSVGIDHIKILGYTDNLGNDGYNAALSLRRANAVADILIGVGIPRGDLTANGMGKQDPIGDNHTANGRALNRRVMIIVDMPS